MSPRAWIGLALAACSAAPRVQTAPPPLPPTQPPCPTCCEESIFLAEVDPASTLDFKPTGCTLRLAGWYALEHAILEPRHASVALLCRQDGAGGKVLVVNYHGPPVTHEAITNLADPYHTGGREDVSLVSYSFTDAARRHERYRFDEGEVRFHRLPRARLDSGEAADAAGDPRAFVELGLDLRFEGDRRFRAALRICPSYESYGPVSDPVD